MGALGRMVPWLGVSRRMRIAASAVIPEAGRRDTGHPLGPMVVVLDRR
jgi:hypothetical protein